MRRTLLPLTTALESPQSVRPTAGPKTSPSHGLPASSASTKRPSNASSENIAALARPCAASFSRSCGERGQVRPGTDCGDIPVERRPPCAGLSHPASDAPAI